MQVAIRAAVEKIEEATKHPKGVPRAAEAKMPTPTGRRLREMGLLRD